MKKSDIALIVGVVLVIIISIFALTKPNKIEIPVTLSDDFGEIKAISYNDYDSMVKDGKTFILLIEREGCAYCEQFNPIISEVVSEKQIPVYSIDIATLEDDESDAFRKSNFYLKNKEWGTPTTMVLQGNEVVDVLSGTTDKEKLVEFLEKNIKMPEVKTDSE